VAYVPGVAPTSVCKPHFVAATVFFVVEILTKGKVLSLLLFVQCLHAGMLVLSGGQPSRGVHSRDDSTFLAILEAHR
jgi:hypothetical protein